MNRKLILGAMAGVAAIGLAVGGTTYAAYSDFGDTNGNTVEAGILKLDLGAGGQGNAHYSFGSMSPNRTTGRTVWLASNNGASTPDANLTITLHNLVDTAAPCDTSLGKATAEQSINNGCAVDSNDNITGTPTVGVLSKVLQFEAFVYPNVTDPASCSAQTPYYNGPNKVDFIPNTRGSLFADASGAGVPFLLKDANGAPLVVAPGHGVCLAFQGAWYDDQTPWIKSNANTVPDNAAQGDSLTFDAHFDLTQDMNEPVSRATPLP
ncbi:MAG TPA: hypothetical protein VFT67_04110 [Jatrophihabitantaceae bacterium]|nr:hypothetical protein [Jatrophihabitantaceae bacterium]